MLVGEAGQKSWQKITLRKVGLLPSLGAILGATVFLLIYGEKILAPQFVEWLMPGDPAQHFLGWHFFRSEAWTFPIGVIRSYFFPQGTSVVYTDSLPLIAIPLKLLAPLLPKMFQYQGIWLLSCYLLQGIFACLLLQRITSSVLLIGIGTMFFLLSPIMYFRALYHPSLAAHWVILAALYLYFEPYSLRNQVKWFILLSLTSMIHFYLLFMVFFIWIGYLSKNILEEYRNNIISVVAFFAISISIVFIILLVEGAFVIKLSDSIASGLGYYSMNLLSPFLKKFLEATPGQYEGFNYLGLGVLLAIAVSIFTLLRQRGFFVSKREVPLVVVCLLFFMISLSNQITFSEYIVLEISLPDFLKKGLSIFRASGRMFWPITYILILFFITITIKYNSLKISLIVLLLTLVIQIIDIYPINNAVSMASYKWKAPLDCKVCDQIAVKYRHLTIIPPYQTYDEHITYAVFAANHGMTINVGFAARGNTDDRIRYEKKLLEKFQNGEISEDSLYILKDCSLYPNNIVNTALTIRMDGLVMIAPKFKDKFADIAESHSGTQSGASRDVFVDEFLASSRSQPIRVSQQALDPCRASPSVLDSALAVVEDRPSLRVATDRSLYRHHELLNAAVDLANSTERIVDVYIAIIGRNGEVWFWNEGWRSRQQGQDWAPSFKAVHLAKDMRLDGNPLALGPLIHLPTGQYTLVVVLTQSNTTQVIARAHAGFGLED